MGDTPGWDGPTYGPDDPDRDDRAPTFDGAPPMAVPIWNPHRDDVIVRPEISTRLSRVRSFFSVAFPWQLARVLFAERNVYRVDGSRTSRLERIRSVLGAVIILGAIVRYDPQALLRYPTDTINALNNAALVAIGVVVGLCLITMVLVLPGQRRRAARAMARPIVSVALLLGSAAFFHLLGIFTLGTAERPLPGGLRWPTPDMEGGAEQFGAVLLVFLRTFLSLWALIYMAVAIYLVAATVFAIGDAHPRLAPLAGVALTGTLLVLEWLDDRVLSIGFLLEVSDPLFPPAIALLLQAGGTALVVILAMINFAELGRTGRGRRRVSLRRGPWL